MISEDKAIVVFSLKKEEQIKHGCYIYMFFELKLCYFFL